MQTSDYENLRQIYAAKSDDELLLLSSEADGLSLEAKQLLTAELDKRQLGQAERREYVDHLTKEEAIENERRARVAWHSPLLWLLTSFINRTSVRPKVLKNRESDDK
jgi:hypothetical protein